MASPVKAPYAHVVVCVDPSPSAQAALREARRLRRLGAGRLTLVHVMEDPALSPAAWATPDPAELREKLASWLDDLARPEEGETTTLLDGEHPAGCVTAWAAEQGVDLIVASAHRGKVERALLGSFATFLAYHAPCPVLLVRPESDASQQIAEG
jgi:nucleotide-binding universal stress UspA family protein